MRSMTRCRRDARHDAQDARCEADAMHDAMHFDITYMYLRTTHSLRDACFRYLSKTPPSHTSMHVDFMRWLGTLGYMNFGRSTRKLNATM
jgi:hypothetical protein